MLLEASIYPSPVVSETRKVILNLMISGKALKKLVSEREPAKSSIYELSRTML